MATMKEMYIEADNRNGFFIDQVDNCANPLLLFEWDTGCISLEFYDWLKELRQLNNIDIVSKRYGGDVCKTPELMRELDGCTLCVPNTLRKVGWDSHWETVGLERLVSEDLLGNLACSGIARQHPKVGRPRTKFEFAKEFLRKNSDGNEYRSHQKKWLKKINNEFAPGSISPSTYKRVIDELDEET
ncbi:MAG: hypothetical protein AAF991_01795 [Pseudomonadota bacterium]